MAAIHDATLNVSIGHDAEFGKRLLIGNAPCCHKAALHQFLHNAPKPPGTH
jgi:hypothetical protein